ncbi:phospholipase D-like domain-containing protein [Novosphingobium aquimarinum]|uniref:phospholipase D-like domain-containing protein n=1 Tax=Novosphingobium aquimarinum TaxID=2682494 RepID=UPI0012EB68BE|nr:phospholipase D family protein [Novosphingobium aquimarinum]
MTDTESSGSAPSRLSDHCLLHNSKDAFAARLWLIRSARHSLDVQYYIWHDDLSGSLVFDEIASAAQRGVAVRLLIDDNGIVGLDARLAALDVLPTVEVRLYNPFKMRRFRALEWLFDFGRLTSRMHSKSLTADRRATIIGGRNIGNEYFGVQAKGQFDDLDILATGPVVSQIEDVFERHWQSAATRPVAAVVGHISAKAKRHAARKGEAIAQSGEAKRYLADIEAQPLYSELQQGRVNWQSAPAHVVASMPVPDTDNEDEPTGLNELMPRSLARPTSDFILISGYFVPTDQGCAELGELRRGGVRIRVLTNSYAATDVGVVHSGYAPLREKLLQQGIELFEMPAPDDAPKRNTRKFIRSNSMRARRHSGKSLHAKVYIVDRKHLYVGSANFDPRSAHLNTELGFVIESAELAEKMADQFETASDHCYHLGLLPDGALSWTDVRDDNPVPERTEPGTNPLTRTLVRLLAKLPIERQL